MSSRRIGVDIDGVICNSEPIYREIIEDQKGIFLSEPQRVYGYADIFTYDDIKPMIETFYSKRILDPKPIIWARAMIQALLDWGISVHLLTARPERTKEGTLEWLELWNVPRSAVAHDWNKVKYATDNGLTVMVEDKASTANAFAEAGIHSILFTQRWNLQENVEYPIHEKVIRLDNWPSIHDKIKEILQ